jgi:hypothetical protein
VTPKFYELSELQASEVQKQGSPYVLDENIHRKSTCFHNACFSCFLCLEFKECIGDVLVCFGFDILGEIGDT